MTDDELFREALRAQPPPPVPDGFADRVLAQALADAPSRRSRARVALALGAAAACALGALAWQSRPRAGELAVAPGDGAPREASLGDRARVVLEPGSAL